MVRIRALSVALCLFVVLSFTSWGSLAAGPATITVDPQTRYQTIEGWEAVSQACQSDCSGFSSFSGSLFDQAVSDLGINRLRVEVKATSATSTTFDLGALDQEMKLVVLPLRQRLAAQGEHLWVNVTFANPSGFPAQPDMSAYAQQVLLTYQHLQQTYGFLPDSWEIVLEPGAVSPNWTPSKIADAVRRSDALLTANGFAPFFIIPSSACGASTALTDFGNVLAANGGTLPPDVKEFAYHRYCAPSTSDLQTVAGLRSRYGIKTAMLEHGGATFNELYQDLAVANVSAWEQYTLAYLATSTQYAGYQYYDIASTSSTTVSLDWRAKWLRQIFKFVRAGAVRVGASSTSTTVLPLAFVNQDGRSVVVVWNTTWGGQSFTIQGLPAGTYGIVYMTGDTSNNNISAYNVTLPDVTLASGQTLSQILPDQGVMTIYAKSGGVQAAPYSITLSPIVK